MKPTTTILIGAPLSGDEALVLQALHTDLEGTQALILANFDTLKRQIDFVVITPTHAALLELKSFALPIIGQQNGIWMYENRAGRRTASNRENPWQQTKAAKYALSDEMLKYQKKQSDIPLPASTAYYMHFAAFVCIYPEIHPQSQVTRGDHKVCVASYREIVEQIKSDSISSSWSLSHWRRFAKEHLNLTEATIGEATDPLIYAAAARIADYRDKFQTVVATNLPALFSDPANQDCGEGLVTTIVIARKNFLLLGPSGSAKTFHLHHVALAIFSTGEIPMLLEARKYRGSDFWSLLRTATAPFLPSDPKHLLDDIMRCGLRPTLMVDALNECSEAHRQDLLRGIQAFCLRFDARLIVTSQVEVELLGDTKAIVKTLPLPDTLQKHAIYAHHAGLPPTAALDYFCSGFTNAYDLTIAGRCHALDSAPESRTGLYDRYVWQNLPHHSAVACALLRKVAAEMSRTLSTSWERDTFERFAEDFLAVQETSLTALDEIRRSRLVHLTNDSFSFEHELLFNYFKGEQLRRDFVDALSLSQELHRPRNRDLFEIILPRFSTTTDLVAILRAAPDARVLCRVLSGQAGSAAQGVLLSQCETLLKTAQEDLPAIEVTCETMPLEDGRKRFVTLQLRNRRLWTRYETLLCDVIALSIDHPRLQQKFLDLLDITEWSLRLAVKKAAEHSRFRLAPIWEEAVRLFGGIARSAHVEIPCTSILSTMRGAQMYPRHYPDGLPIRAQLFERARSGTESHFAMLAILEDLQHSAMPGDAAGNLDLIKQGLNSGVFILRASALELLQSMGRYVDEVAPEHLIPIREMLESLQTDHVIENTLILETLASFGGFEAPVSIDEALRELKSLISPDALQDHGLLDLAIACQVEPEEMLTQKARSWLMNIFEDIFQGVYCEAYSQLSDTDKHAVLQLAASAKQRGFSTDWIVRELYRYSEAADLPIFQSLAARPDVDKFCPQESVAVFLLGVLGCARFDDTPPKYAGDDSPTHFAWQTISEILFLFSRGKTTGCDHTVLIQAVWSRLQGQSVLATADVLYQIVHSLHLGHNLDLPDLVILHADQVRPILENCLQHRDDLPLLFENPGRFDKGLQRFIISSLGRIGERTSIPILEAIVDENEFGKDAIQAIEAIRQNAMRIGNRRIPQ